MLSKVGCPVAASLNMPYRPHVAGDSVRSACLWSSASMTAAAAPGSVRGRKSRYGDAQDAAHESEPELRIEKSHRSARDFDTDSQGSSVLSSTLTFSSNQGADAVKRPDSPIIFSVAVVQGSFFCYEEISDYTGLGKGWENAAQFECEIASWTASQERGADGRPTNGIRQDGATGHGDRTHYDQGRTLGVTKFVKLVSTLSSHNTVSVRVACETSLDVRLCRGWTKRPVQC